MKISIVTPTFNEEKNITLVIEKIKNIMLETKYDYEHIIIDNNSTDKTQDVIKSYALKDKNIKAIFNLHNYGQSRSPYYAMLNSSGDAVIEIGGGYGSLASILYDINKNIEYTIYDLPEVNLLQFYYLKSQNINCEISSLSKNINLLSELELLKEKINILKQKKKKLLIIANWSLSEMPISLRKELEFLFFNCDFALVSFQSYFENISNLSYFKDLEKKLINNFSISTKPIQQMNTFFNSNKHFCFLVKNHRTNLS